MDSKRSPILRLPSWNGGGGTRTNEPGSADNYLASMTLVAAFWNARTLDSGFKSLGGDPDS